MFTNVSYQEFAKISCLVFSMNFEIKQLDTLCVGNSSSL